MNIPSSIYAMLAGIALTLVSLWLGQNHGLLPEAASEESYLIDGLFNAMMTISVGLFLIVEGVIIFAAIKFRKRAGDDTDGAHFEGNIPLEILWTAIPAVLVLGISVYSFEIYNQIGGLNPMGHAMAHTQDQAKVARRSGTAIAATLSDPILAEASTTTPDSTDPPTVGGTGSNVPPIQPTPGVAGTVSAEGRPSNDLVVNVTGLQFAWIFTYPDRNVTSGELHVPIGRTVRLNLEASDVIHAFWVPEFRLKQDAIPGQTTALRFTPTKAGVYPVICAELCGAYHGVMKTTVLVETPDEFNQWLTSQAVASREELLHQAIAATDATKPENFLAPYTQEMGITAATLKQIPTPVNPSHHHADL